LRKANLKEEKKTEEEKEHDKELKKKGDE